MLIPEESSSIEILSTGMSADNPWAIHPAPTFIRLAPTVRPYNDVGYLMLEQWASLSISELLKTGRFATSKFS